MTVEKAKETLDALAAAQAYPTSTGELLDLSNVAVRTKNMSGEEGVLAYRGYVMQLSSLASSLLETAGREAPGGQARTPFVEPSKVSGSLNSVGLRPSTVKTNSTLPVRWDSDGRASINLKKLLMVRPFPIPKGQRAHIPLDLEMLVGVGLCLVIRFPKANFEAVEVRKSNNGSTSTTSTKNSTTTPPTTASTTTNSAPAATSETPETEEKSS